jgi:hypothetical protein
MGLKQPINTTSPTSPAAIHQATMRLPLSSSSGAPAVSASGRPARGATGRGDGKPTVEAPVVPPWRGIGPVARRKSGGSGAKKQAAVDAAELRGCGAAHHAPAFGPLRLQDKTTGKANYDKGGVRALSNLDDEPRSFKFTLGKSKKAQVRLYGPLRAADAVHAPACRARTCLPCTHLPNA